MDRIYTPPTLAKRMVEAAEIGQVGVGQVVADFAVGLGGLLVAAEERWPEAELVGTDIDHLAVRMVREKFPHWRIGVCDFLNVSSRKRCLPLRGAASQAVLVLLNPPFSSRGGTKVHAVAAGRSVMCSIPLAFLVNAIDYLTPNGTIVAVLPEGSLTAEKNERAWDLVGSLGEVNCILTNGHRTFKSASVRTVVVRFTPIRRSGLNDGLPWKPSSQADVLRQSDSSVTIVRGTVPVHDVEKRGDRWPSEDSSDGSERVRFIHSTNLRQNMLCDPRNISHRKGRSVSGPMVLIPRVGQPHISKIAGYFGRDTFLLSDCVIALTCGSEDEVDPLWQDLRDRWTMLEQAYVGSGARYITVARLSALLETLGYKTTIRQSDIQVGENGQG